MHRSHRTPATRLAFMIGLMVGLGGCRESSAPDPLIAGIAIRPVFGIGVSPGSASIARTRIRLARESNAVALDTVVVVAAGADSVELEARVSLSSNDETLVLTVAFINSAGDTVYRGGPISIQPGLGDGDPVAVDLPITYVGPARDVLVISNFPGGNQVILDSFPQYMTGFNFDTLEVRAQTPSLALLMQYPVVLLYEDGLFPNAPNVGDTVAAYVQGGGNLVIGTFYWQDRSDNVQFPNNYGWGQLETLDPFLGPYGSEYRPDSLSPGSIVAHPMTAGITTLFVPSFHGGVMAKPGTTVLARWSDACTLCAPDTQTPLLGYRIEANGQRIVGVSLYPAYPYYGNYGGDFYRLWANVLDWASAGGPGTAGATTSASVVRAHPAGSAGAAPMAPAGGSGRR
jgi:hypothetical protein